MIIIKEWIDITADSLKGLWIDFIDFIPRLAGSIIVFLVGWVIAVAIGKLIAEILKRIQFDKIFEKGSWKLALEKADIKVDASAFIGAICKWVLVIFFLAASIQVLGFKELTYFLTDNILVFLPNVVVAAFIFVIAVIIADILEKVVKAAVEGARVGYGEVAGAIVRWSIWVFAALAILQQLGIGKTFMTDLFRGIVVMIVLVVGLSFGLGGKEIAADILRDLRNRLAKK